MSSKKKRVSKSGPVWHRSAEEATLDTMPKYNGYACGIGVHGDVKYNRARQKSAWQKDLQQERARHGGSFLLFIGAELLEQKLLLSSSKSTLLRIYGRLSRHGGLDGLHAGPTPAQSTRTQPQNTEAFRRPGSPPSKETRTCLHVYSALLLIFFRFQLAIRCDEAVELFPKLVGQSLRFENQYVGDLRIAHAVRAIVRNAVALVAVCR